MHRVAETPVSRRELVAGGAALTASAVSGCLGVLEPPPLDDVDLQIVDVRAPSIGATSLTMPLILEFHNTGNAPVPNTVADFRVSINGDPVATAETRAGTLDPGERARQRIDAIVYYSETGTALLRAIQRGSFTITLDGSLASENPIPFLAAERRIRLQASTN